MALINDAADLLQELVAASTSFAEAVKLLTRRFAVIEDLDTTWFPVVELVDERLVWKRYAS